MAFVPAPNHIMMIGPSAIFGKLLSTIIYGSKISLNLSFHHNIIAIKKPKNVAITKPTNASKNVILALAGNKSDWYEFEEVTEDEGKA